jgi:hypothetical protein
MLPSRAPAPRALRQPLRTAALSLTCTIALCVGEQSAAHGQAVASAAASVPVEGQPRCNAGLRLVGSVMNARHPGRSKAALRNKNGTRVMEPGQRIDNLTLLAVKPTSAILQTPQGDACYIPVYLPAAERPPAPAAPAPPRREAKPARPKQEPSDALKRGVRELGPGRYVVTREVLTQVLGNPAAFAKTAGVRPLIKDGRTVGMQLIRLRPDSPLRLLGLEKGDVLRHVNGNSLATPDGMLQALQMLRNGTNSANVMLGLLRKDAPLNISIAVQ